MAEDSQERRWKRFERTFAIIGVVAAVVAIPIAIYFGFRQSPQKAAEWRIEALGDLVSVSRTIPAGGQLEILFDGRPVQNVQFMVLAFHNTGGLPIDEDEYRAPLSLIFGDQAQIFTAEITEKQPDDLETTVSINENQVTFSAALLNAGDSFSVQIIGTGLTSGLSTGGRILGISNIELLTSVEQVRLINDPANQVLLAAQAAGAAYILNRTYREKKPIQRWLLIGIYMLIAVSLLRLLSALF